MKEENRENTATLLISKRRNGKSTFIVSEIIPEYLKKGFPVVVIQGKRNDTYTKIEKQKSVNVHLIKDIKESMPILENLYNAVVIFDDAQLLIGKQLDDNVRKMIINLGQCNVDIIFVFHSFTAATRELWTLIDYIVFGIVKESAKARSEFLTDQQVDEIDTIISKMKPYEFHTIER